MIEIRTLGHTSIIVDGEELSGEAAWPRALALVVYMAREPGPDRRDDVMSVLWPDREEKRARHALNQMLYTLRKASPGLDLESIQDRIDFGREVWLDVEEFERRLEEGELEAAVGLYRGPFLADLLVDVPEFEHWADRQRADLRRKFRKAALELVGRARSVGDHEKGLAYCRRLVEIDPLDDEAQHALIELLYLSGDRVGALRQYDEYRELLTQELEVEPLEATVELVERIRENALEEAAEETGAADAAGIESGEREAGSTSRSAGPGAGHPGVADLGVPRPEEAPGSVSEVLGPRGLLVATALASGVLGLLIGLWLGGDGRSGELAADRVEAGAATAPDRGMRIAVPPFQTVGLTGDRREVAIGVAQLLARNLTDLGPIRGIDQTALVQRWDESGLGEAARPPTGQVRGLAREMGAGAVVVGTVHGTDADVRIIADVLDASTGEVLARADVHGPRNGLFALIDRLTLRLVEQLWAGPS